MKSKLNSVVLAGIFAFWSGCADEKVEEQDPPKSQYEEQERMLIGSWSGRGLEIVLNEGGEGTVNGAKVYWQATGENVTISGSEGETALKGNMWKANQHGGTLTLTSLENKKTPPIKLNKKE